MTNNNEKLVVPLTVFKTTEKPVNDNAGTWAKGAKIEILSSYSAEEKPGCARSFVELIDHLGSDLTVVNAARVSFGKEKSEIDDADKKLLRFLAKHNHWTPYSQPQIQFRFKMPAFVARQYFKHTVGLTRNEISRRYVNSAPELWIPKYFRESAPNVKQGSAETIHPENILITDMVYEQGKSAILLYEELIRQGVCAEQARSVLPVSFMVDFVETGSLAAYMRIFALRKDKGAQKEIQDFAVAIGEHCYRLFPNAWNAVLEAYKED